MTKHELLAVMLTGEIVTHRGERFKVQSMDTEKVWLHLTRNGIGRTVPYTGIDQITIYESTISSEEPTTALEDFPEPAFIVTFAELDVTSEKMNAKLSFEPLNEWLEKYADDLRLIPKR